jgi:general secretion pathway protein D
MLLAIVTAACEKSEVRENMRKIMRDPIDREGDITYNEFKDTLRPAGSAVDRKKQLANSPQSAQKNDEDEEFDLAPVLLPPDEPEIKSSRLVSLSITPDIRIRDVLLEVARQAKLDMAIDPYIEGGIYLSVKDKPVGDVVQMICDLAELKYTVEDSVLRIERDKPYIENYSVDIMNLTRSTTGSVTTNTSVSGISTAGGGGGGLNTGSSNKIDLTSSGDLWKSIDDNLKKIIELEFVTTLREGEVDNPAQPGNEGSNNQTSLNAPTNANRQNTQQNRNRGNTANNNQANEDADKGSYYTINRQAGIITVNATQKKHKFVQKYLAQLKKALSTQVLIEAKVLEVNLAEQFGSGISWRDLIKGGEFKAGSTINSQASGISSPSFTGSIFDSVLTVKGRDPFNKPRLSYVIEAIQQYGTIRTLSNPRITALNNSQAVLSFALNKPFYDVTVTAPTNTTSASGVPAQSTPPTMNATVKTVPIGIILTLYPLIHIETGEITINIRPTISRDTGETVRNPSVDYAAALTTNQDIQKIITENNLGVPVVEVRELDTVLKIKSGDVIVLGGLIEHRDQNTDSGIPFLSKVPIIGNLAKKTYKTSSVKETVILIQATILNSDGYTHEQDRNMYKTFAQDPRPLTF